MLVRVCIGHVTRKKRKQGADFFKKTIGLECLSLHGFTESPRRWLPSRSIAVASILRCPRTQLSSDFEFDSVPGAVVERYKQNPRPSVLQTFHLNSPIDVHSDRSKKEKTNCSPSARPLFPTKKMGKRTMAMVLYDAAAAAASQQGAAKRARPSAGTGTVVPHDVEPINAVPLNAIAPPWLRHQAPAPAPAAIPPEEPARLRTHVLPALGLRADLPVHFVDRKRVTGTDLDAHQNRFRVPSDGVLRRLRPILTPDELDSANLLHDPAPKPKRQPEPVPPPLLLRLQSVQGEHHQEQRKKRKGKVHGGLPVRLVDVSAGASGDLLLSRWESSSGTIVKGEGYMDFVRRCSFKQDDVVDIWAFKQREFRLFGKTMFDESDLHLLIVKAATQTQ
jgi:hypothetical protein